MQYPPSLEESDQSGFSTSENVFCSCNCNFHQGQDPLFFCVIGRVNCCRLCSFQTGIQFSFVFVRLATDLSLHPRAHTHAHTQTQYKCTGIYSPLALRQQQHIHVHADTEHSVDGRGAKNHPPLPFAVTHLPRSCSSSCNSGEMLRDSATSARVASPERGYHLSPKLLSSRGATRQPTQNDSLIKADKEIEKRSFFSPDGSGHNNAKLNHFFFFLSRPPRPTTNRSCSHPPPQLKS